MQFEFATATRIVFGRGKLRELPELVRPFGHTALVLTGASPRARTAAEPLLRSLHDTGIQTIHRTVHGEPTVDSVRGPYPSVDMVIAFGGGSVLDAGKAIAALMTNDGDPLDYVEVIGRGRPLQQPPKPFIAIPTTAGTGSEVTRNAVLGAPQHRVKVSLRSALMLPRLALLDPDVCVVTPACGLDALTQLIEPFVSRKANPMTDALCREGMRRVRKSLRAAIDGDADARADMALAAMWSGMALANAGLGAVHGFAGPLGGMYNAPHGALCAALLPAAWEVNERAVRERAGNTDLPARFAEVRELIGDPGSWPRDLGIPGLRAFGVRTEDFPIIVEKARAASSMKGNPVELADTELHEILRRAW
ncbi:MAG: iron-containing alcohol dehydrogenase [Verrucomicrobiae bacterium]|nr:iron-containing alcohol dehydrogenase [Verrucomicrobiae bacterium]